MYFLLVIYSSTRKTIQIYATYAVKSRYVCNIFCTRHPVDCLMIYIIVWRVCQNARYADRVNATKSVDNIISVKK